MVQAIAGCCKACMRQAELPEPCSGAPCVGAPRGGWEGSGGGGGCCVVKALLKWGAGQQAVEACLDGGLAGQVREADREAGLAVAQHTGAAAKLASLELLQHDSHPTGCEDVADMYEAVQHLCCTLNQLVLLPCQDLIPWGVCIQDEIQGMVVVWHLQRITKRCDDWLPLCMQLVIPTEACQTLMRLQFNCCRPANGHAEAAGCC